MRKILIALVALVAVATALFASAAKPKSASPCESALLVMDAYRCLTELPK